jgi:hypothetical protein
MENKGIKINPVESRKMAEAMEKTTGFFTVTFIKQDDSVRKMNARVDVTKHLKGGKSTLDPNKYVTVWDVTKREYRAVNRERIIEVKGVKL